MPPLINEPALFKECENIGDDKSRKHVSRPESYCYSKDNLRLGRPWGLPRPYYDTVINVDVLTKAKYESGSYTDTLYWCRKLWDYECVFSTMFSFILRQ